MDEMILTRLLNAFIKIFTLGAASVIPEAMTVLRLLATIEIGLLGIWWIYSHDNQMGVVIGKLCGFGILTYFMEHWSSLTKTLLVSFIQLGIKGGGGGLSETDFTDPSNIAMYGISVTAVIFQHVRDYGAIDMVKNLVELLLLGITGYAIVLAYFCLAILIFVALVEFYAVSSISVVLLPFAIFQKTAFLTEKAISKVFADGVRVLALSFVTSALLPLLVTMQTGMNPTFKQSLLLLLMAMTVLTLALMANRMAQGLLYGSPQLTSQHVSVATTMLSTHAVRMASALHLGRLLASGGGSRGPARSHPVAPPRRSV